MNTLMLAEPVRFPLSVTEAVIVWVPAERVLTGMEPPVPSGPSRFEFHWSDELRLPSSVSLAVAVKLVDAPEAKVDPFAGALILSGGGVLTAPLCKYLLRRKPSTLVRSLELSALL